MNTITKTALVAAATLMACHSSCEASFVRMGLNRDQMPVDIDEILHANFDRARRLQREQMRELQIAENIVLPEDNANIDLPQKDEDPSFIQVIVPEPEVAAGPEEVMTNPEVAVAAVPEEVVTNPVAAVPEEVMTNPDVAVAVAAVPEEVVTNPVAAVPEEVMTNPEVAVVVAAVPEEVVTNPDTIPDVMSDAIANDANKIPPNETLSDGFQSEFFNMGDKEEKPEEVVEDVVEEPEDIAVVEVVATNPNDGDVKEVISIKEIVVVEGEVHPTVLDGEASSSLPNLTQETASRGKLDSRATEISFMIIMDDFRYSDGVESLDDIKIGTKFGFTGRIATKAEELGSASGSCTVTSDIKKEMSYCDIYHRIDTDNFGGFGSIMVAGTADEVGGRLLVTGSGGSLQSTPNGYAMIQFDPAGNPVIYVLLKLF